jgi:hypothetical protein
MKKLTRPKSRNRQIALAKQTLKNLTVKSGLRAGRATTTAGQCSELCY